MVHVEAQEADTSLAEVEIEIETAGRSVLGEFWHYFSENRGAVAGLFVFIALVLIAILAPLLAPHEPYQQYRDALLLPPAWAEGGSWTFPLGTDPVGRDILSRLIYGARLSLLIGLFSRQAAFIMSGEMAFAYFLSHSPKALYPLVNGGDAAILYCFVFLYIAFAGPGPLSIDAKRGSA